MATDPKATARVITLLAVLSVAPYLNALTAGFTLDDLPNIRENAAVTKGVDLTEIFATPMPLLAYVYRPFTVLSFAVNEALTPGDAVVFHAVNLILHAGVTVLVFWLAVRLFDTNVAVIAAALFALHPVHTEAVTSIVGRAELLTALFALLTVLSAGAMDETADRWPRNAWHGFSVLCFAVAVFSKESAVSVLPLVLLYRVTRRAEPLLAGTWKEVCSLDWVPYALCFGVFLYLRFLVVGTLGGVPANKLTPLDNALGFVPWDVRLRSALGVMWDYFALLNVPLVLSADYSYAQVPLVTSWLSPRFLAGAALLLIAAGAMRRRELSPVRYAGIFPFIALSLTANLLLPIGTIKGERLLYLPSIGWALVFAYAIDQLSRVRRYHAAATVILVVIVAAFAARTWMRNWDWKDNPNLFASTARTAPNSAKAHYNLGVALQDCGADAAAEVEFRRALDIMPKTEGAAFAIGAGLNLRGANEEAAAWYRKALEIDPGYGLAHQNLCRLLLSTNQLAAATAACRNGLRYHPADADLLKGLGASLVGQGETEEGVEVLRRSLLLNQDDDQLRIYLAQLKTGQMQHSEQAVTVQ